MSVQTPKETAYAPSSFVTMSEMAIETVYFIELTVHLVNPAPYFTKGNFAGYEPLNRSSIEKT